MDFSAKCSEQVLLARLRGLPVDDKTVGHWSGSVLRKSTHQHAGRVAVPTVVSPVCSDPNARIQRALHRPVRPRVRSFYAACAVPSAGVAGNAARRSPGESLIYACEVAGSTFCAGSTRFSRVPLAFGW